MRAIAIYMAGISGAPAPDRKRPAEAVLAQAKSAATQAGGAGAAIYAAACATCHETSRQLPYGGVNLALSTAITSPDPRNLVNIVLSGVSAVEGEPSPIMPGFAASMDDARLVALLNYLRARFSKQPAWNDPEKTVRDARLTRTVALPTSPELRTAPADPSQRGKP